MNRRTFLRAAPAALAIAPVLPLLSKVAPAQLRQDLYRPTYVYGMMRVDQRFWDLARAGEPRALIRAIDREFDALVRDMDRYTRSIGFVRTGPMLPMDLDGHLWVDSKQGGREATFYWSADPTILRVEPVRARLLAMNLAGVG